ncbi:MAG: GNAT family N-acetyltransferase [Chloroflexi bacterium]|nr:GNAT family N-acetyltransferase [Chloroflexota bacterium]
MILREYTPQDKAACLDLFDSNLDPYFLPHERAEFSRFLDKKIGEYFVVEDNGDILGCGGIAFTDETGEANLTWGMINRQKHRQGIGSFLTEGRLERIRQIPGLKTVTIQTSQHTVAFYARYGFEVREIIKDGFGPGLDNYKMTLSLIPV